MVQRTDLLEFLLGAGIQFGFNAFTHDQHHYPAEAFVDATLPSVTYSKSINYSN